MPIINERDLQGSTLRGEEHGATISLILDNSDPGGGPRLHRHPYDEIWVVERGNVTFQAGEESLQAVAGDIVIVPPNMPHKFTNDGPDQSRLICIHANPRMVTEWLE
jgi:quercetin dioxygenase-like cupin family protein